VQQAWSDLHLDLVSDHLWPIAAQVVMDQETGKPRGFGFVTFEDVRDAQDAVADSRGKVSAFRLHYVFQGLGGQWLLTVWCHLLFAVAGSRWQHVEGECS
jgi:hypothetical protein